MKTIPINVDRNVSHKEFEGTEHLYVTSIFHTIQGEGPYAGQEAVFIRLAGCNIGKKEDCPWCDTYFAIDDATLYTPEDLASIIAQRYIVHRKGIRPLIVVTGGEPFLQFEKLAELVLLLGHIGPTWQFETNGLLLRAEIFAKCHKLAHQLRAADHRLKMTFVISPKIPHNADGYKTLAGDWTAGVALGFDIHLKYVVSADESSPYHLVPSENLAAAGWPLDRIWVSGMTDYTGSFGTKPGKPVSLFDFPPEALAQTAKNYGYAARLALVYGYRVSYQTHLLAGLE